jgi:hypothetical protein
MKPVTRTILDRPEVFDELAERWLRARSAALRTSLGEETAKADAVTPSEHALLARALDEAPDAALRAVFDNSRALGKGFRQYHRTTLALNALPAVLSALRSPCLDGVFRREDGAEGFSLVRTGCAEHAVHPRACAYWREASLGLLLGLTEGVALSRHSSREHGARLCVDVLHAEGSELRYGAIPAPVRETLDAIVRQVRAFDGTARLDLLGMSEGELHYRLQRGAGSQLDVQRNFERSVKRRLPDLPLREVSPRPVFAGE